MKKQKAAFFDRDGTIIEDVHYLSNLKDISVMSGVVDLCKKLQDEGYWLFVVTNQSGVARGFFDSSFVEKTHDCLKGLFKKEGVDFKKFYYCPHGPDDMCDCRKPKPGMIYQAAKEFNLELKDSLMFGDKDLDFQAGISAGCKSFYIDKVLK